MKDKISTLEQDLKQLQDTNKKMAAEIETLWKEAKTPKCEEWMREK